MADPFAQQKGRPAPSPFAVQMLDDKFRALSYEDQQSARIDLYQSRMKNDPNWQNATDDQQIEALKTVKDLYPPAFSNPQYELLRQKLEDPSISGAARFIYDTSTQMGLTGLLTRGVINTARALGNVTDRVGQFFGARPSAQEPNAGDLMLSAMTGDRDGVKLAQYLQKKYERPVNPAIPLIGGQTPTQLLGSALGYGFDIASTKGIGEPVEGAVTGASALVKLGARAAFTGALGVARGAVAQVTNALKPGVAAVEGAIDSTHGIVPTLQSVGTLWGMWAAQDLAFGMLGQGAAEGLRRVGGTWARSLTGQGGRALPQADMFEKTEGGEYTPAAQDLQRRFLVGNLTDEARSQLGPAAKDYAQSNAEVFDYSRESPTALADNPVAAWRFSMQRMMDGKNTPLGIATVEDGPATWRLRTGLGRGGEVLGEHLSFPEAEMVTHGEWEDAINTARANYSEWEGKFEKTGSDAARQQMLSYELRMNALQDAFPHDRTLRDSLTIIQGNMDRLAPEGAAKAPSEGPMLTYGEVGQLQGIGMKVAKTNIPMTQESLADLAKRGEFVNSDMPTRFAGASNGDYNGAIVYSKAAPEAVYQAALGKAQEYIKAGANATQEQLAYWKLRDMGFDAIQHDNGDVTALYPRQQVKHVSDFVNKSNRDYTLEPKPVAPAAAPEGVAPTGTRTSYAAPDMLGGEQAKLNWLMDAANREANTRIVPMGGGQYQLHMFGMNPVQGDLATVTDVFLTQSTSASHLRASLQSEGMDLKVTSEKSPIVNAQGQSFAQKQYSIIGRDGKVMGVGQTLSEAMVNAKYRPKLIDGRFGPTSVEILPEGSRLEVGPQSVRGSLSDVRKYVNQFMDVAEEEGKTPFLHTDSGGVFLGHDGAYTVEIPAWGIREKFASASEAKDYLNGKYKDYGNVQRLANERGFSFDYDPKRGFVLSNATGTFNVHSMNDVGKILARVPDTRWAPGGQFDAGVTLKDSADAVKLTRDTFPNTRNTGKTFYDRSAIGKAVSNARSFVSTVLAPARATMARFDRIYGLEGLSKAFNQVHENVKTMANQNFLDVQKVFSIERMYNLTGEDGVAVKKVMQALSPEEKDQVLDDLGYREGSPKRPQIMDAASRLSKEFYDPIYERTGQDPNIMLTEYSPKEAEFRSKNPDQYREMEMQGPSGMTKLIQTVYGGRVPEDMKFQALHERVADMDQVLKEHNAFAEAALYAQHANRWAYVAEPMKAFWDRLHAKDIPDAVKDVGTHYINEVMNGREGDAVELLRALGKEGAESSHRSLVSYLQTAAGMGTYGFRPSSAMTILEHNYLIGSGFLGTEAVNNGFRTSAQGGLAHLQDQFQKGVFSGRVPVLYGFGDASMGSNWFANLFNKMGKASVYFVQNGHILGRSAIYDSASWLFDKHVKPWMDSGKLGDWNSKVKAIRGYYLDPGSLSQVEGLLAQGDYAGARHAYAQNMTDQITFTFRPEDQGWALNKGMVAKMYGQLMVAPTHYASALTRMAGAGSFTDRVSNLATYAKNTAAFYGASRLAGMTGNNLLPWRVVTLSGGPLWQNMTNLIAQKPGTSKQLADAKKALISGAMAVTPLAPQVVQASQVIKDLEAGNGWGAFLTANGFSASPDLRSR